MILVGFLFWWGIWYFLVSLPFRNRKKGDGSGCVIAIISLILSVTTAVLWIWWRLKADGAW